MHISSLPSPWGIGTLGAEARRFADFLCESGQSYWQVLPLSPTGYGDSPYQSFSAFAGNPYFIDLDTLNEWGLLTRAEYCDLDWGGDPGRTDYGKIFNSRFEVLRKAASRLIDSGSGDYNCFCQANSCWLDDYSLFMAIKDSKGGAPWTDWERGLRFREEPALSEARAALHRETELYSVIQYLFFSQWEILKKYANTRGISIIGDVPIYAAPDSADVWSQPRLFLLDGELKPVSVAGCPPDGFTEDGQLWGNPVYDWNENKRSGYFWWINRIKHQFEIYDVLRLDHFRGFDAYYSVPFGSENAKNGVWKNGPGIELFRAINNAIGEKRIIAEDLGFLTDSVRSLLSESGYPGMKVLQFAFGSREDSDYLPHNFDRHCVAYAGTHDNDTILGWFASAPPDEVGKATEYLRIHEGESKSKAMLSTLWGSVAELAIAQMQDLLELGSESRMNTPSTPEGNWQWRMRPETDLSGISSWLKEITLLYGRAR